MDRFKIVGLFYFVLAVYLSTPDALAQAPQFQVTHVSENIGLSHQTVTNVMRDSRGFLWISTMDGLNRYDGKRNKIWRHVPGDSTTLSDSFIHAVTEFDDGSLWIATRNGGFSIMDPVTDQIRHLTHSTNDTLPIPETPVNLLYKDASGFLWAAFFYSQLGHLDRKTGYFTPVILQNSITGEHVESVNSILEFGDGSFFISSYNGLYYIPATEVRAFRDSPEPGSTIQVRPVIYTVSQPSPNSIYSFLDSNGNMWVYVLPGGVTRLDPVNIPTAMKESMQSGTVPRQDEMIIEEDGFILHGHEKGTLKMINKITGESVEQRIASLENEASGAKVFRDTAGQIWYGSWGGGLYLLKKKEGISLFNRINTDFALPSNFMLSFADDSDRLWIGTAQGLAMMDKASGKIQTVYFHQKEISIWSQFRDQEGLWLATRNHGLIFIQDSELGKSAPAYRQYTTSNSFLSRNNVHQVFLDSRGWLWLGYEGAGIQVVKNPSVLLNGEPANITSLTTETEESGLGSNNIRKITEDASGAMWVATNDQGFYRLRADDQGFHLLSTFNTQGKSGRRLSHNDARSIYQQNDSTFWLGTYGGGIHRWISTSDSITNFTTVQGLANNSTYGILPDTDPELVWVSTNNGLSRLNTKTLQFTNFTISDGLQNNEFNTGAYYKTQDSSLVFGGVNGFNIIDPEKLAVPHDAPAVYLTEIRLFDTPIESDSTAIFKKHLKLNYTQNFLSFEFAALELSAPSEISYSYRMDGVDESWVRAGNRAFASYPNLAPGNYTFAVKAANSYGEWDSPEAQLSITISPPWWQTIWFRAMAGSLLLIAFAGSIRYFSQRNLRKQVRRMEIENRLRNERERISRDLHDHVGAQLANIISGLSLVDKYTEFNQIEKSTELMKSLKGDAEVTIKQLRDTIWALNQNELTVQQFADHLGNYFKSQSALNELIKIQCTISDNENTVLSSTQALNLFRIIQEASQNTLKYAGAEHLDIHFKRQNGELRLSISDDGTFKGDAKTFNSGYGMLNMKKRAEEIGADLRVFTDNGTTITLSLEVSANN